MEMNSPIAVIDARSPREAIEKLREDFSVIPFLTEGITYDAIAGHPDVFMTEGPHPIVAPNTPDEILKQMNGIAYQKGRLPVGTSLEESTRYNCVIADDVIIHKQGYTDEQICLTYADKTFINTPQAYTRCNTLYLRDKAFICSDMGIANQLMQNNCRVLYVSPEGILLPPYKYGFIGGCLGVFKNRVYCNGALESHPSGREMRMFIESYGFSIVELHQGRLYDGGGILFLT